MVRSLTHLALRETGHIVGAPESRTMSLGLCVNLSSPEKYIRGKCKQGLSKPPHVASSGIGDLALAFGA